MNIKKSLLIAGVVTSISAVGLGGSALVHAQSNAQGNDGANSLVTKLAQKFNLKTEDVQAVFDEDKTAKDAERQAKVDKELSQAVTDGKLTSAQKDKIIAKAKELQAERKAKHDSSTKDSKTKEERKANMDAKRTELEKWASDNSIPTEYLRYVGGGPGGHGRR